MAVDQMLSFERRKQDGNAERLIELRRELEQLLEGLRRSEAKIVSWDSPIVETDELHLRPPDGMEFPVTVPGESVQLYKNFTTEIVDKILAVVSSSGICVP